STRPLSGGCAIIFRLLSRQAEGNCWITYAVWTRQLRPASNHERRRSGFRGNRLPHWIRGSAARAGVRPCVGVGRADFGPSRSEIRQTAHGCMRQALAILPGPHVARGNCASSIRRASLDRHIRDYLFRVHCILESDQPSSFCRRDELPVVLTAIAFMSWV